MTASACGGIWMSIRMLGVGHLLETVCGIVVVLNWEREWGCLALPLHCWDVKMSL